MKPPEMHDTQICLLEVEPLIEWAKYRIEKGSVKLDAWFIGGMFSTISFVISPNEIDSYSLIATAKELFKNKGKN